MSEELENSLQQAIESYLGKRLGAIDEQLARLQSEFDEALKSLRESASNESLSATPLSAAIFAHLQTARTQRLSGTVPESSQNSGDLAAIKRAVEEIERQQTHTEILGSLLTSAAQFAERAALFVVRNDQAIGWRECEASDPTNLELIGGVSLPLSSDTMLGRAARAGSAWTGAPGSNSEDSLLIDQLGGDPQTVLAVPLVVRGRVVAILYADSVSHDPGAVHTDALELLARIASMAVSAASAPRAVPEQQAAAAYTPEIESQAAEEIAATVESVSPEPVAEYVPAQIPEYVPPPLPDYVPDERAASATEGSSVETEPESATQATTDTGAERVASSPAVESTPQAVPLAAGLASQYATPLGTARRYGVSEPDLPIDVGDEERRLHNDARRFARLLVSEIKLYNEPKVKEGRSHGDIYDRLREDIDRSRQMYDKRVAPPVAARHDYFHQELVNTLAEGDLAKLGGNYPGAAVISH